MQIDNFMWPSHLEWIRYENRNALFARPCNSGKLLTRECNCNIVVTKLHGVLRAAISHTRRTIEGYAGTDRHSGGGTQITVHCHASNATCYVLLCYWRIIDVALASCAHPCNEPTHIARDPVYSTRLTCTYLVRRKKRYLSPPRSESNVSCSFEPVQLRSPIFRDIYAPIWTLLPWSTRIVENVITCRS